MRAKEKYVILNVLKFFFQLASALLTIGSVLFFFYLSEAITFRLQLIDPTIGPAAGIIIAFLICFTTFMIGLVFLAGSEMVDMTFDLRDDISLLAKAASRIAMKSGKTDTDSSDTEVPPWSR